jgi:CheY-like chemotaxis protein/anti-sigma regulatory factor (Ser/Thr protein kinase)
MEFSACPAFDPCSRWKYYLDELWVLEPPDRIGGMMSHAPALAEKILVADDDRTTRFAVSSMLQEAGYAVTAVTDGAEALRCIQQTRFALAFLDIWMPEMTGIEVLARVRMRDLQPKIIIMTSDGTPEMVLRAIREQAYEYLTKPFPPKEVVEVAKRALEQNASPPIEVISARPHWVELLIPCTRDAAERIQSFLLKLEADLPEELRTTIGMAFRELLLNAVEWGGKLDPNRKVRIACVRSSRMLLYRVADPGPGFSFKALTHAAVGQPADEPIAHAAVREQLGIRPGGFGIAMTRAMADELLYNEAQNEVIFVKYLSGSTSDPQ